ncbi:MAG: MobF family relaxase [Solirubrobacterales bacterium]
MLTIGKLGAGQEAYYLEKVAGGAEDYYSGEGEAGGRWRGDAARDLGLEGEIGAEQLTAMLTGRDPATGDQLLGNVGVRARGAVPGFDLTFSAPKSVSLLWALGDPGISAPIRDAHERSIDAALGYLERQACWTRRGAGGATFLEGSGYLAAAYRHRSSRAGDPQLHTHVLIANATRAEDGRWTRLYHPAIYEHAKTAGYPYEAQLRHELTQELGVRWQEVRNGIAELIGFTDRQLREFSTRRAEILAAAGADASARARQVATLATRSAKERELTTGTLRERWAERALEVELDQLQISLVLGSAPNPAAVTRTVLTAEQVDRAVTARASHFDRRDAVQAVAQCLPDGAEADEVERTADAYLASENIVSLGQGPKGERFTTVRIWELEQEALSTARRMRAEERPVVGETVAEGVIGARPSLKADQRRMVERLLAGSEGLQIVIGEAGTGKSYAIAAAAEGWAQAGISLRAAAPTWQAANVLEAEGVPATSIACLLGELDDSERRGLLTLPRGSVLLIDEAAMVDSRTLGRLISQAARAEAKLVLVGDPEQLPAIEAGGLFRALAERSEPIRLDEVIRHNHELEMRAAKRIREGRGVEAFELYRSSGRVVVAADAPARREAILADWWASFSRGEEALIICQRNAEVERLNAGARSLMRTHGRLEEAEIEVGGHPFAAGDHVVTRVNDLSHGVHNRERWLIAGVDPERREVALRGLDQQREVVLGSSYLEARNPQSGAPAIEHTYASNLYLAQGRTVERAFVAAEPSMDRQDFYVALSRAREQSQLYLVAEPQSEREEYAPRQPSGREQIIDLREAIERDGSQLAAVDEALRAPLAGLATSELVEGREALESQYRAEQLGQGPNEPAQPSSEPEAELAIVESLLAERRGLVIAADRARPPGYVTAALGERPADAAQLARWERGVELIERHRQTHGIRDRGSALGREPESGFKRAAWERSENRLAEVQRQLGRSREIGLERDLGISFGP